MLFFVCVVITVFFFLIIISSIFLISHISAQCHSFRQRAVCPFIQDVSCDLFFGHLVAVAGGTVVLIEGIGDRKGWAQVDDRKGHRWG